MSTSTKPGTSAQVLDTDADFVALNCDTRASNLTKSEKHKKRKKEAVDPSLGSQSVSVINGKSPETKRPKKKNRNDDAQPGAEKSVFFVDTSSQKVKENGSGQAPSVESGDKKKRKKAKRSVDAKGTTSVEIPEKISVLESPDDLCTQLVNSNPEGKEDEKTPMKIDGKKEKQKKKKNKRLVTTNDSISAEVLPVTPTIDTNTEATRSACLSDAQPVDGAAQPSEGKKSKKDKKAKNSSQDVHPTPAAETVRAPSKAHRDTLGPLTTTPTPAEIEQFISTNKITYEPAEMVTECPPILEFDRVKVTSPLEKAFLKFQKPSPIQSAVWPVLMANRDVVGIAETGSGKTLAFGIPAFEHILSSPGLLKGPTVISVLVIAPTRELAMQTEATLSELGRLMSPPIKTLCVYGGVDKNAQRKALKAEGGVRAVAGTPGRLLDLANEGHLKLDNVSWLVLDEADRMLDKGFENDIRAIINLCLPSKAESGTRTRLTAMFSATWPLTVRRLASDFMRDPVRILVGDDQLSASCSVEQTVEVLSETRGKEFKLLTTLNQLGKSKGFNLSKDKIIVFALYKKEAQRLHQFLVRKGFQACCIEGDMSQDKRTQSLEDFKTGRATMLVATDVAARGLDIPKVEVVINVTFPLTIEDYIHRIGRTGRAGRTGKSITFFTEDDKVHAGELMRVLKDANQAVPEDLKQWGGQIKKKTHAAYGDHWKDIDPTVKAKKIKFD